MLAPSSNPVLAPICGISRITDVDAFTFDRFKELRINASVSPAGVNRDLAVYRAAFNFAIERRLLTHSPLDGVKLFNETKHRKVPRVLSFSEEQRILMCCDLRLRTLIMVLVDTGMRVGIEALKLKWIDVDFEESMVTVYPIQNDCWLPPFADDAACEICTLKVASCHKRDFRARILQPATPKCTHPQRQDRLAQMLSEWRDFPHFRSTSAVTPSRPDWQHRVCRIRSLTSCSGTLAETCLGSTQHGSWSTSEMRWCASINYELRRQCPSRQELTISNETPGKSSIVVN